MSTQDSQAATAGSNGQAASGGKPDIEQIQADIEQTRQELSETVDALTAKLDVKSRARDRLNDTKQRAVTELGLTRQRAADQLTVTRQRAAGLTRSAREAATDDQGKPTPAVLGAAAALVSAVVATSLLVWRRRR
jgi:chromosome segregation ATPase